MLLHRSPALGLSIVMRVDTSLPPLAFLLICVLGIYPYPAASLWLPDLAQSHSHSARYIQHTDHRTLLNKLRDIVVPKFSGTSIKPVSSPPRDVASPKTAGSPPTFLTRYEGDIVLRFTISDIEEAKALAEATNVLFLDVWEFTTHWADIRLARDSVHLLLGLLPPSMQHAHTPLMHDLAQSIFASYQSPAFPDPTPSSLDARRTFSSSLSSSADETNLFFRDYQPLSVIIPWMRLLRSLFPSHVRMISIGTSYEGRDIPALRIGVHPTNSEKPLGLRKTIIVTGGTHAREWISTSTVNYIAYSLITGYGKSNQLTKLLENFDWIFIPTLNPDGYVYTWETDRLWRKNRQQTSLRFCKGVDLDRTYGFEWAGHATKGNPCSESFSGEGPFQGVESRQLVDWVKNETKTNSMDLVGFLDFHAYSQQVLYPYSYSCATPPPSLETLEELGMGLAKAIRQVNGEIYGVTSACEGSVVKSPKSKPEQESWPKIEPSGGSALDHFYHELKVRFAYQIKLRDTGNYGFLIPSKNIVPTGKEALAAVQYFGNFILGNNGIENAGEDVGLGDENVRGSSTPVMRLPEISDTKRDDKLTATRTENDQSVEETVAWELRRRKRR